MSFRDVRSSKFRHVYGTQMKREECYESIGVLRASYPWDSSACCAVNPKFLAIIVDSPGAFIVLQLSKVGQINADHPVVKGHRSAVLAIAWCPNNDNVIASGSEDGHVKIWQVPDGGLSRTLTPTDAIDDLVYHQSQVVLVFWHPTAHNVLFSAGDDHKLVIWNVETGETTLVIDTHPHLIFSASLNLDGSQLVTTWDDMKIRFVNPSTGEIEKEALSHEGSKFTRAVFLKNGLVFTTGFSKLNERQYSLRALDHLEEPIVMVELDSSNGVMVPFYDPDTSMVYLWGEGDSYVRYFELTAESPFVHYINTFQTSVPQSDICMMPKRGLTVNDGEIARFYCLNNAGFCQVVSMTVPWKSQLIREHLYPHTPGEEPGSTAEEWLDGKDAQPIPISLKDTTQAQKSEPNGVKKATNILDQRPITKDVTSTSNPDGESMDDREDNAPPPTPQSQQTTNRPATAPSQARDSTENVRIPQQLPVAEVHWMQIPFETEVRELTAKLDLVTTESPKRVVEFEGQVQELRVKLDIAIDTGDVTTTSQLLESLETLLNEKNESMARGDQERVILKNKIIYLKEASKEQTLHNSLKTRHGLKYELDSTASPTVPNIMSPTSCTALQPFSSNRGNSMPGTSSSSAAAQQQRQLTKCATVTGKLEVRLMGCLDLLEDVPGRSKSKEGESPEDLKPFVKGVTGRSSSKSCSIKDETSNEIMAVLKLDNQTVAQTAWKHCSQAWDQQFSIELDKSGELEIDIYWRDWGSPCAVKILQLEEFIDDVRHGKALQLEPQGLLFAEIKFLNPVISRKRKLPCSSMP